MVALSPTPKLQFIDGNGDPFVGGKLTTYIAGTTTKLPTFTDSTGDTPNTNPIILGSRGEASVWLASASYKYKLETSADVLVETVDNININQIANISIYELGSEAALANHSGIVTGHIIRTSYKTSARIAGSGSDLAYTGTELGSGDAKAGDWPNATTGLFYDADAKAFRAIETRLNARWWGATGDNSTDDAVAIQSCFNYIESAVGGIGGVFYLPTGRYVVTVQVISLGTNTTYEGDGHSSVIVSKLSAANAAVYIGDGASSIQGVVAQNFRVTGEYTEGADVNGGSSESELLHLNECLEGQVLNVRCEWGANDGFRNAGSEQLKVYRCTFRDNLGDGMVHTISDDAVKSPPLLRCVGNTFKDNGDSGLRLTNSGAARHVVENNTFEGHNSGGDKAGIVCYTNTTRMFKNKFELNTNNIIVGDTGVPVRASGVDIQANAFSGGKVDFRQYSQGWIKRNTFTNSATIVFGADENNDYTIFESNIIQKSDITINATSGKIIVRDVLEGSTSDLQQTFTDQDATPDVAGFAVARTANTVATTITNFENGYTGMFLTVIFGDDLTTISNASGFFSLSTDADITPVSGAIIVFEAIAGTGATSEPIWRDISSHGMMGATLTTEVTLSAAQVNALRNTSIELVPAPGAGKLLEFVSAMLFYDYTTTAFTVGADEDFVIRYNSTEAVVSSIETTNFIDQTNDEIRLFYPTWTSSTDLVASVNDRLEIFNTGSGETADGGTSTLRVVVTYRIRATGL